METVVVTFVYPNAVVFFQSFISSMLEQTDKQFELIVFNDNCTQSELSPFKTDYPYPVRIIDNKAKSIAQSRINAFKLLQMEQYQSFIFCDIDDMFDANRIEIMKATLNKHDIVINDLTLCDTTGSVIQEKMISQYLRTKQEITWDMIKEQNLIGFSHLAVNHNIIDYISNIVIDDGILAVDWIIMSHALQQHNAYFERRTCTQYVFHQDNIALSNQGSMERLLFTLEIKINTYSQLLDTSDWYRDEMNNLIQLKKMIYDNEYIKQRLENYCKDLSTIHYPWWSQFKNSEELKHEICI